MCPKVPGLIPESVRVLDVRAAFAGFCIFRADVLLNPMVRWDTIDVARQMALVEHVLFCHSMRVATGGGRIVVATRVDDVHWVQ
jgi:hypothetical protein